jgi:4-amino-4-deoxy-L-arabinose transferase-like glycosyltransferase
MMPDPEMGIEAGEPLKATPLRLTAEPNLPLMLGLLAAFVTIWTLYFAISDALSAIHNDMAEAYVWGQEFQLGYNQHPPFWAWICGLWFSVLPRSGWAFAILTSLNAGIGLCGAWMLIGNFADGRKRLAATVLLLLTPFYTFLSYKYNANSIFLSVWPWTLHFFVRSIDRRQLADSLLFGLCVGLAMMSKYYALILVATCFIAAVGHPARSKYFASTSPYVSAAVAAVICAPHAWWLLTSGAPPLRYLAKVSEQGLGAVAGYSVRTFLGSLALNGAVLLTVALVARTLPQRWMASLRLRWQNPTFRTLVLLTLLPLVLTILAGFVLRTKISTNMMIGTFSLVPLLAIEIIDPPQVERLYRVAAWLAAALTFGALALSPAIALTKAWLSNDDNDIQPRKKLALEATRLWHAMTHLPLAYVGGDIVYADAVAFYGPDRPHVFVKFDFFRNQWVTPQDLAEHGLLAICVKDDRDCLASTAGFATPRSTRTELSLTHGFWGHHAPPANFVVTIIPPRT